MNVVGRVGSLISQGVYSVATPFHPFGGAVDVIVVQQQDGTFRSTPWYVRFGKFQGVLKGAEKIVRINVNGVEANFHMYLDNSGEACFVKEIISSQESETNGVVLESDTCTVAQEDGGLADDVRDSLECATANLSRLDTDVSDSVVIQLQEDHVSSVVNRLERAESDSERRFYDFQDEQSSQEGSVELSEYGSTRYDNLEGVDHFVESQDLDSEVILVSVDGHVLTAPILQSEENNDNLQLCTPQFHLGPGKGADLCEANEEFHTGEDAWAGDYVSGLNGSTCHVVPNSDPSNNADSDALEHQLEVCEGESEHVCQSLESQDSTSQEIDTHIHTNSEEAPEDVSDTMKREEIFKSCLELSEFATQSRHAEPQEVSSPVNIQEVAEDLQDQSLQSFPAANVTEDGDGDEITNKDGLSPGNPDSPSVPSNAHAEGESTDNNALGAEVMDSDNLSAHSVSNDQECQDEQVDIAPVVEATQNTTQDSAAKFECCQSETVEPQTLTSSEGIQTEFSSGFEISLCGNKLCAGMGLSMAAEVFDAHRISEEEFKCSAASIIRNENLIIRYGGRYLPWDKAAPIVLGMAAFGLDLPVELDDAIPVDDDGAAKPKDNVSGVSTPPSGRRWRLWPIPFRRVKTLEPSNSNSSNDEMYVDPESGSQISSGEPNLMSQSVSESPHKQLLRTHIPTTEQIASLNLKEGQNIVTFSFSTRVLGTQQVDCHIYLWKWNARIVISDVDGTITRSDVLGQFMPLVGKDWTQSGVARLFSAIKENGYQLLFLSARAIVQAYLTRSFLLNLKQDGKALPNGPVVISPDGLFPSLYREVIRRAPHEFKIACLEDIRALFPDDYNPFYAGFGNRDTDELSYRKIGIPKGKIFIINPKGEVAISHRIDVKSYTSLHTLVNDMFPPTSLVEQEDYNSWNFWRMPLPEIDL